MAASISDSGYEDEMDLDVPSFQRGLRREGTNGTILVSHDELTDIVPPVSLQSATNFFRGPNGELVDRHGRQMLGREGTILIDSTYGSPRRIRREAAFLVSRESVDHSSLDDASLPNGLRRARSIGPAGTELVD